MVLSLQINAWDEPTRPRGIYYRWDGGDGYVANLVAVIEPQSILRSTFETTMIHIANCFPLEGRPQGLTPLTVRP